MLNGSISTRCLKVGDRVGLVTLSAPEAAANPQNVERGVRQLSDLGLHVKFAQHALDSEQGYLASFPAKLAQDLNDMFLDPDVAGIICTGGGTNANRLLPLINYEAIQANPKPIVGMSNPTVVLNAITAKTGMITYHGPVLVWNFGAETVPSYTLHAFQAMLMADFDSAEYIVPQTGEWKWLKPGEARGRLLGGNLWSLQSLLGTPYEPRWDGAILVWEDIAKEPKRLDAMLTHFKLAGVLDRISGMVVGELTLCDTTDPSLTINEILTDLLAEYNFPVLTGVRFGHTDEKLTLPIGGMASLYSSSNAFVLDRVCS